VVLGGQRLAPWIAAESIRAIMACLRRADHREPDPHLRTAIASWHHVSIGVHEHHWRTISVGADRDRDPEQRDRANAKAFALGISQRLQPVQPVQPTLDHITQVVHAAARS
jgi:hypothetical protein